jgi:hypothetical protein
VSGIFLAANSGGALLPNFDVVTDVGANTNASGSLNFNFSGWSTISVAAGAKGQFYPDAAMGSSLGGAINGATVIGVYSQAGNGVSSSLASLYYVLLAGTTWSAGTVNTLTIGGTPVSISGTPTYTVDGLFTRVQITPTSVITSLFGTTVGATKSVVLT